MNEYSATETNTATNNEEAGIRTQADAETYLEGLGMPAELPTGEAEHSGYAALVRGFKDGLAPLGAAGHDEEDEDAASRERAVWSYVEAKLAATDDEELEAVQGAEETPGPLPSLTRAEAIDALTARDLAVYDRLELDYSLTLKEAFGDAPEEEIDGVVGRLADADLANLMAHGKERVLALAGATSGDVEKAARRARSERLGERLEEKRAGASVLASGIVERIGSLGRSTTLDALYAAFLPRYPRAAVGAVLSRLAGLGLVNQAARTTQRRRGNRTVRVPVGPRLVFDAGLARDEVASALASADAAARSAERVGAAARRIKGEAAFAEPISANHGEREERPDMLAYLKGRAALMGADAAHLALAERLDAFRDECDGWMRTASFPTVLGPILRIVFGLKGHAAVLAVLRQFLGRMAKKVSPLPYAERQELLRALPFKATMTEVLHGEDGEVAEWVRARRGWGTEASVAKAMRRDAENREAIERARKSGRPLRQPASRAEAVAARKNKVRRLFEEARAVHAPEKVALNTARAVLASRTDLAGRVLLALDAEENGMAPLAGLFGRLSPTSDRSAGPAREAFRETLKELLDAGAIRVGTLGSDRRAAAKLVPEAKPAAASALLRIINDPENGIAAPEGFVLAPQGASEPVAA